VAAGKDNAAVVDHDGIDRTPGGEIRRGRTLNEASAAGRAPVGDSFRG
jgi:hypothetical protein